MCFDALSLVGAEERVERRCRRAALEDAQERGREGPAWLEDQRDAIAGGDARRRQGPRHAAGAPVQLPPGEGPGAPGQSRVGVAPVRDLLEERRDALHAQTLLPLPLHSRTPLTPPLPS